MSYTEKAGNLLPQNCPELEQFIKAQAHIRAADHLIEPFSIIDLPHLPKEQRDIFHNLVEDTIDSLWECDSKVQNLMSDYFLPLFPVTVEPLND